MKKLKYRFLNILLYLFASAFVILSIFLIRCFATFGSDLFSKNTYNDTAALADLYKTYLNQSLEIDPGQLSIQPAQNNSQIYIVNYAPPETPLLFEYSFIYNDSKQVIVYRNTSEYQNLLSTNIASYSCSSYPVHNMPSLSLYTHQALPSLPFSTQDSPINYTMSSYLSTAYMDRHSPYIVERFLFDTFHMLGIPILIATPILLIITLTLFHILSRQPFADRKETTNIISLLFPRFFFWDFNLYCFLFCAVIAFLLPFLDVSMITFWLISLFCTGWALFFLMRFVRELRFHDPHIDVSSHLFFRQLLTQKNDLFLFLLFLILFCIPIVIAGYVPVRIRWIFYLLQGFLILLALSRFYSLLSLKKRIKNLADNTPEQEYPLLPWPFSSMETNLEQIQNDFMSAADERLKGERLKAELITNFSHDLKTPLTSILNYIQLLKKSLPSDPAYDDYIRVLETKSAQLRDLTENLLDLSRFSSGAEPPHMQRCDFLEIVRQANGEFSEQLEARNLSIKSHLPSDPVYVMTDGGKIWRIMENLYGNVIKYALEGTRVYVNVKEDGEQVTFTLRNISRDELTLSPDEFTERFVRGDTSRHTEGNGLGLSTVQTLTNLLGGQFYVDTQGDLFTVSIVLPTLEDEC